MLAALLTLAVAGPILTVTPRDDLDAALRELRGKPNARLRFGTGDYRLSAPLRFGREHAGLTIEASPGARPRLIGGIAVRGWRVEDGLWVADVPKAAAPEGARLLVVNGKTRPRSRWPVQGELLHESVFDVPWMSTTGGGWQRKPTDDELTSMVFRPGDLGDWVDPASAEITVYHMWDESCVGVKAIDNEQRRVTFATPTGHPPGAFGVRKYVVWNTLKGIVRPGQWAYDGRVGRVWYRPMPGERPGRTVALLGTLNTLIRVEGTPGLTLRGLTLEVTNVALKAGGFGAGDYDGAILATDAPDLRLDGVTVRDTAGTGIKAWNCARVHVRGCTVEDTGAGGIRAEGEGAVVEDCTLRRVGLQYPSAIGVWVGRAGSRIRHNWIEDTSYSAVNAGGEGTAVEFNEISKAMRVLHDGAGIYAGFSKRLVLRGNLVRDIVDTGGYGASAYYLDEQAEDSLVEGNVSQGIVRPAQNHMARRNVLRNNLFMAPAEMRLDFARCEEYTVIDNVFVAPKGLTFRAPASGWAHFADNAMSVGTAGARRVVLEQYNETTTESVAETDGNRFGSLTVRVRGRLYEVVDAEGKPIRVWDLRTVGPRGSS
ncbi:MAG: right-handed parallel beta-helix repeat-containing protein [Fimbriimonadaceae bacterium]|nr:right-handed parallel beta-helix repeat-containing protein [Fimbriimonadaceae bacterium]